MNPEPTPSPAEAHRPNCVYVGTFNGYRCYIEDPEAVAQAIQRAAYQRALEEAEGTTGTDHPKKRRRPA